MRRFVLMIITFVLVVGCGSTPPPRKGTMAKKSAPAAKNASAKSQVTKPAARKVEEPAALPGFSESRKGYDAAMMKLRQGLLPEAASALDGLLAKYPQFAFPQFGRGMVSFQQGRLDEAAAYFSKAIAIKPTFAQAYHGLAQTERQRGHYDDAEKAYQAALRYDKNNPALYYNLGILYDVYLGAPKKALGAYREYLKLVGPAGDKKVQAWIEVLERSQSS